MKTMTGLLFLLPLLLLKPLALAYPLDGTDATGIQRLQADQQTQARRRTLPSGALLSIEEVDLRLTAYPELSLPAVDKDFTDEVLAILNDISRGKPDNFGIAVLDLSDIEHPVYAEHHGGRSFYPASVGKLSIAMGLFQALAQAYPEDIEARRQILRETEIVADTFIRYDTHKVPIWQPKSQRLYYRELRVGDTGNLWTYLDWMLSASSNAAASMSVKQMMLLSKFGREYPPGHEKEQAYFNSTPKAELKKAMAQAFLDGVDASGLENNQFHHASFFTSTAKKRVPGDRSYATPRELMRFLLHLEQGKVVDEFSSREIKRLLYVTKRRIRYASSPALNNAAVYFKSGSYYRCKNTSGVKCEKYRGDAVNLLNSVAIIESPAGDPEGLFYMVVVTSNVLKESAALLHHGLGTRLQRLIEQRHTTRP